ncbi:MAG: signal peptide peptidase SppA [Pelotomaculum sp.]|uniref:Periplasmic serine proteases n=1 Tax=Pelotomaculum thermopropionicum (strain DSM 13744 / JCM 10971 / SI) TaxID=370438 RepID=A5CY99_PELTS|nr:signal peptide peptidase SppA [Pelotomaculum sp.]BAF61023.1 Periplasmic serine proteases [Pelotomaculum thermopropionicum SI]
MKKKIIAGVVLGVVALTVVLAVILKPEGGSVAGGGPGKGEVGIIYIDGPITGGRGGGGLFETYTSSEQVTSALRNAARNPDLKAVVIRLNSPGGTAAAAQEISAEVERLKRSGKKVVASMGDSAASGAYWIAACADQIVANPGTLTGSIGVIIQYLNLEELYSKIGVDTETFKSGPHKDMGSPSRPATAEERAIFQSMIDDIYNQFVDVVARGRHKDPAEIRPLADGRIFTGRQAKELGLVDRLGDLHDAVLLAGELAGIKGEPAVVEIGPKNIWQELFAGAGGNTFRKPGWLAIPGREGDGYPLGLRQF